MTSNDKPEPDDKPEAKPPSNRHWYQFSLRTLLTGMTLFGMLMAVMVQWIVPARRQQSAVKAVEKLGGKVEYASAPAEEWGLVTRMVSAGRLCRPGGSRFIAPCFNWWRRASHSARRWGGTSNGG